jgi:hypothetical protein
MLLFKDSSEEFPMNPMSRNAIRFGIAALMAVGTASAALARPDARNMTCEQAQRLIERSGAVVMTTGRHTYDRFVGGRGQCSWPEVPMVTYVRTSDTRQCPVYNCQYYEPPIGSDFGR